ncbi:MAG: cysteine hydrolase family protein [Terriglobales bacterium]
MATIFWDVDTQVDFMDPTGKLYVPGAEAIVPKLAQLTRWAGQQGILVVASACAHLPGDKEFEQYPPHCLAGTPGQKKIPETLLVPSALVPNELTELDGPYNYAQVVIEKQQFDVFSNPNMDSFLPLLGNVDVVLYGVVTEFCVAAAARGLLRRGYKVSVVTDAIRYFDLAQGQAALDELQRLGARLITSDEILRQAA